MLRTIGLLAVLAGALLLSAPNAQADWKIDRAQAIAEHVWNYDYGCDNGVVAIRWGDPALVFSHAETAADLARDREVIAWVDPISPDRCVVNFNGPLTERWGMDFTEICSAMIHEYGHLAGMKHSTNPRSIMYPDYQPDRRCRKRGRPYLNRYNLL